MSLTTSLFPKTHLKFNYCNKYNNALPIQRSTSKDESDFATMECQTTHVTVRIKLFSAAITIYWMRIGVKIYVSICSRCTRCESKYITKLIRIKLFTVVLLPTLREHARDSGKTYVRLLLLK